MSNKIQKNNKKAPQKKINFLPIAAILAVAVCFIVVLAVDRNQSSALNTDTETASAAEETQQVTDGATAAQSRQTAEGAAGGEISQTAGEASTDDASAGRVGAVKAVSAEDSGSAKSQVISQGESLVISTADLTEDAAFYPIEVDGTSMEVFAIKASDGTIRTAFNTCQSCYTSGAGFYTQQGGDLVCNNCGFHFTPDEVETTSGGCNPWPIFAENKTVTDDTISISYDFLSESKDIFANWKTAF